MFSVFASSGHRVLLKFGLRDTLSYKVIKQMCSIAGAGVCSVVEQAIGARVTFPISFPSIERQHIGLCRVLPAKTIYLLFRKESQFWQVPLQINCCTDLRVITMEACCWLYPCLREFGENVRPFISRLRFFFFFRWRLARAH